MVDYREVGSPVTPRFQNTQNTQNAGAGRSRPTGYSEEEGDVRAQELQFDNGYKVLAIQVLGQKAFIKGAGPWRDFTGRIDSVKKLVSNWLSHVEGRHPELLASPEEGEVELVEDRRNNKFNMTHFKRRATDQKTHEKVELRPQGVSPISPKQPERTMSAEPTQRAYPQGARLETIVERLAVALTDTQQEVSRLVRQVDQLLSTPPSEEPNPPATEVGGQVTEQK